MSTGTSVAALPSGFQAMQSNIVVTMDDVVSAFVSKYETQLFTRKKELAVALGQAEDALKEFVESVRATVDVTKHNKTDMPFDLVAEANNEFRVNFEEGKIGIEVRIQTKSESRTRSYYGSSSLSVWVYEDLPAEAVETHKQHLRLISSIQAELADVLDKIKAVARKEREVRGRIAMRKIEESGYSSLLEDGELLSLVQL